MTVSVDPTVAARSVFQAINEFAIDRSAGSLDIVRGHTAAIVHVVGGRLTSAEPSAAPGIAQRLLGGGRLSRDAWHELRSSNDGRGLAERLVTRGIVDPGTLAALTRSVLVDALLDLVVAEGEVVATPLEGEPDWLASPLRLDVEDAMREVSGRMADRAEIPSRAIVALRAPAARCVVLTREQVTVACHVRRDSTVSEIARESGLALYETARRLSDLIGSGLCVLGRAAAPVLVPTPMTPPADPDGAARPEEDGGTDPAALPRRVPGSAPGLNDPVLAPWPLPAHHLLGHPFTTPDEHVMGQVLEALKNC
jgi:hypothetical protein